MAEHNQRFDSFEQWVNKASSWLTRHPDYNDPYFRAYCFDAKGRQCLIGKDFMRARDEDAFPIRWIWPDQIPLMADFVSYVADIAMDDVGASGAPHMLDMLINKAQNTLKGVSNGEDERNIGTASER